MTKRTLTLAGALVAAVLLLAALLFLHTDQPLPQATGLRPDQTLIEVATTTLGTLPDSLVVLYTTTATSTDTEGRNWPTKNIWRRVGNTLPEVIAKVGKVGEYPAQFILSPTHNYVAVNLEKAVDIVNLNTKEKTRIFTTNKWVIAAGFSSDGSKLIIADGATYLGDVPKPLYSVDIKTGKTTTLVPDVRALGQGDIDPQLLRNDNVLLFYPVSYKDCGGDRLSVLSLTTKTATTSYERYGLSDDGMLAIGSAIETVPTPPEQEGMCSPGTYPTVVSVVEPVSGQVMGRVGKSGEPFTLVAFSPDRTEILFKTSRDLKNYTYYLQKINTTSSPNPVADPWETLASWKASAGPVTYAQGEQNYNALYIGDTPIVVSPQWPDIIGQYFQ